MGQVDRHGHQLFGFIAGISEHHALIACPNGIYFSFAHIASFSFHRFVDAQRDICRLAGNGDQHTAGIAVHAFIAAVVADVIEHFTYQLIIVDQSIGGDLAQQHHEAGLGGCFAGNARERVLFQARIQDCITDLIANLVGMAFCH